eukprot:9100043-Alexandrium_andersonii.AAC.1
MSPHAVRHKSMHHHQCKCPMQEIFASLPEGIQQGYNEAVNSPGGQARGKATKIINQLLVRDANNKLIVKTDQAFFKEMIAHQKQKYLDEFHAGAI